MVNDIGVAMRGCILAGCVLAAVSAQTVIKQQSSSAWGAVKDGVSVDQGTHTSHTSHTSDTLPEETELGLRGAFGPGFALRGGFGGSPGGPPQASPAAGQDSSQPQPPGVDPASFYNNFFNYVQQNPEAFPNLQGGVPQPQAPPVPGNQGGLPQRQPNFNVRGDFPQHQAAPGNQGDVPQSQSDLGVQGGYDSDRQQPPPSAGAEYDASRQPQPTGAPDPRPADSSAGVPVRDYPGHLGQTGADGAVVAPVNPFGHNIGWPSDIGSLVSQMTSQVFQNAANRVAQTLPVGGTAPGYAGNRQQLGSRGGPPPGAPPPGAPLPGAPGGVYQPSARGLADQSALFAAMQQYYNNFYGSPRRSFRPHPGQRRQPHINGYNAIYEPSV